MSSGGGTAAYSGLPAMEDAVSLYCLQLLSSSDASEGESPSLTGRLLVKEAGSQ